MLKPLVVAAAGLAIAGSSIVYAQQRSGGSGGPDGSGLRLVQRHVPSTEDMAAFTDARIAALKAGLELTPDQAKNWPAFEQALRDMAQIRMQRIQARAQQSEQGQSTSPFDRLAQRADTLAKASAALKHIAETGAPLYQSLSDAQKERFKMLAHMLRPHRHFAFNQGFGHGWRDGQGNEGEGWRPWWRHDGPRFQHDDGDGPGPMHHLMEGDQGSEL